MSTPAHVVPVDRPSVQEAAKQTGSDVIGSSSSSVKALRLQDAVIVVDLDPWPAFGVAWIALFIAHSLCIAFLVGTISALRLFADPKMGFFADLLRRNLRSVFIAGVGLLGCLVALHTLQLFLMLLASVRERKLQFTSLTAEFRSIINHRRRRGLRQSQLLTHARRIWRLVLGRQGFFGVESPYYEWRYAASEAIEIVSQSVQAYGSSAHLDPKRWLIDLYVACAVLNCWSTPIVMHAMSSYSLSAKRLACVVLDAVLDSGTAMVFPLVLVIPYTLAFDPVRYTFDVNLLYNDVWFINFINENRQIFPVSGFDLLIKVIPHASIFLSLKSVRSIIRRKDLTVYSVSAGNTTNDTSVRSPLDPPTNDSSDLNKGGLMNKSSTRDGRSNRFTSHIVYVDRFFILLAFVVLACHISSTMITLPVDGQCKLPLRPWFIRTTACSLYMFNCYRRQIDSVYGSDLAFLHRKSLAVVVFAHCPGLRMTRSILDFPNLLGIETYNSTLVEWGSDVSLSAAKLPVLSYIFIIRTNLSEIPEGMRSPNLPSTLMDIEFSVTNLSSVPDDLDSVWSQMFSVYIENSHLTKVQDVLLRMPLSELSLIGNQIDTMPTFPTTLSDYYMLSLARNPITTIPISWVAVVGTGVFLDLVDTGISEVPAWFRADLERTRSAVYLHGTPFCSSLSVEERGASYGPGASVTCALTTQRLRGRYPLNVTKPLWLP